MLLAPLRAEMLTRTHATALGRISDTYGEQWSAEIVATWFGRDRLHPWGVDPRPGGLGSVAAVAVRATARRCRGWRFDVPAAGRRNVAIAGEVRGRGLGTSQPSQRERHL